MNSIAVSMEFFPPKSPEGEEKLRDVCSHLSKYCPAYYSVTFGAAGSTKAGTVNTVEDLLVLGYPAAPHISCLGSTKESIRTLLSQYKAMGVRRLVALRGDLPSGFGIAGASRDQMRFANTDRPCTY